MSDRLSVDALAVGYPDRGVLSDIHLQIGAGEVVGLIGPNGAGKSTLLRAVSGALRPTAGRVTLSARPLEDWPVRDLARQVAVVGTQEHPQGPTVTVRDYVALGRTPYQGWLGTGSPADTAAIERAVDLVGVRMLADRPFAAISAGERQRCQLARALAQDPDLLLLDEPTAHLDIGHQQQLLALLRRIAAQGVAVVLAIHDLNLAASTCDRLILLHGGTIVAAGPPEAVLTRAHLQRAYGHPWLVRRHPVSGRPFVFPGDHVAAMADAPLLHLIGGGGALAEIIGPLQAWGYRLQVGVLHEGDSDVLLAQDLGIPALVAPSFAPIAGTWITALDGWLDEADAVVLADVPFGPGNVGNLLAIGTRPDLPLLAVGRRPWSERDFTGGQATALATGLPLQVRERVADLLAGLAPTGPGAWPLARRR